jgi:UDP:flavonoid glycosyltransferase YjiC (YdhE family)
MVEAMCLGKPVLSEPIQGQYEQQANATALEIMGVGKGVRKMSADAIVDFAAHVPAMREKAGAYASVADNDGLVRAVEDTLNELAPGRALPPRQAHVSTLPRFEDYALAAE